MPADPAKQPPPTARMIRNACVLASCEAIGIYFFFLHLQTWWLASAALGAITATAGVLLKWSSYAKDWLPAARYVLGLKATFPVLTVSFVAIITLLLTTVSVNVRLVDGTSAKIKVVSSRWRTSDILSVDSDRKDASRRYFLRFAAADVVVAPVADYAHSPFTAQCLMPGTALEVRIPYSFPARHSVCLLPAMGMRLPLPTAKDASRFSGFVLIDGKKYPFSNWKVGALCFGGHSFERQNDPAIAGAIDGVAGMYFDSHGVETSPPDRAEYLSLWKSNISSIVTPDLKPRDDVYVEIDEDNQAFLRQVLAIGSASIKIFFVEQQHEPKIVDEEGR